MHVHPLPGISEPVSALTHLVGAVAFAFISIALLRRARGDLPRFLFCGVYAASCVLLLLTSGLFHMLPDPSPGRAVLGRLDAAAIFVLIAGTHTPLHGLSFRGVARWSAIFCMWLAAAAGIVVFVAYYDHLPRGLAMSIYLVLGWLASMSGFARWKHIGTGQVALLMCGGLVYSLGAVVLGLRWPTIVPGVVGPHEVWHLAVLLGMALHFAFLFRHASPVAPVIAGPVPALASEATSVARTAV